MSSQLSLEQEQELIRQQATELLLKLNRSFLFLQKLNKDIESRPFSTRLHGQFDHELKKSQSIIAKLSSLLRKYHSFEFSSNLSLDIKSDDTSESKPIDQSFIIDFKDICLRIEREWRIGTKQIIEFQSKYGNKNNTESEHYHSDTDTRYSDRNRKYKHIKNKNKSPRSHSQSRSDSPIHSFSNPNSPLFSSNKMSQSVTLKRNKNNQIPTLNIGLSQSQILQHRSLKDAAYHAKIGGDFVPYDEQEKLNQQIRDINEDLQYLLDINKQVNDLVRDQQNNVDDMERKVSSTKDNIEQGTDTLTSIRRSPVTYAVFGGIAAAVLGGPVLLVGVGVKAAIGGSIGLGTVGALSGSMYANKVNDKMDDDNKKDKEEKLLNDDMERKSNEHEMGNNNNNNKGFRTVPRKRRGTKSKEENNVSMFSYLYNSIKGDDEQELDEWDARN